MQRILALFKDRDTRDELGLGGIRDSFADQLFPGTSTIQTRLRYMLFIPWIYRSLEKAQVPASQIANRARWAEISLVGPLLDTDAEGIFGRTAGGGLKRLPSSVYWAGLGIWGIRQFPGTREQYHRGIDEVYRRRRRARRRDDGEPEVDPLTVTWHPQLPDEPEGFPERVDFRLTPSEAEFIRDCIVISHPRSLLAHLAIHPQPVSEVPAPWMHPGFEAFQPDHQELLRHAGLFSDVMYGASILYNLLLALEKPAPELEEEHRAEFRRWAQELDLPAVRSWSVTRMWELVLGQGHMITYAARRFVEEWAGMVTSPAPERLADAPEAWTLVRRREERLKGGRSRFRHRRALDQWGGYAGMTRIRYRWPTVQVFLTDLYQGLEAR
jgi:hypothetical protein